MAEKNQAMNRFSWGWWNFQTGRRRSTLHSNRQRPEDQAMKKKKIQTKIVLRWFCYYY